MTDPSKPKTSLSDDTFTPFSIRNKNIKSNNIDSDPGTSFEVFRNNTTAVEVIVKEVPKNKKKLPTPQASSRTPEYQDVTKNMRLQAEIDTLKIELNKANSSLARSQQAFLAMVTEIKKQLDAANRRELETQTKNLSLQLENEKLKALLNVRTNLLNKFKNELNNMKRVMRFVMKTICFAPQVESVNVTCSSDPEYEDFENDLKSNNVKVKFAGQGYEEMGTFDSSISKDPKYSCDKRMF